MVLQRQFKHLLLALLLVSSVSVVGCLKSKGTMTHRVTAAQHSFQGVVLGFQDAEIAESDKGFVPVEYHVKIQVGIQKVALAGRDLDNYLVSNSDATTVKAKLDEIYNLLDAIQKDGLSGVKNPTSKALLEVALDGVKAIVDNALVQTATK